MATQNITYTDKEQGQSNSKPIEQKYTFEDANEVKTVVNNNATELSTAQTNISTNATDIATNVTNIGTAQATADAALPKAGGTLTGAVDGDQSITAYRPISETIAADSNLEDLTKNQTTLLNTSANDVTITITDAANASDAIGDEYEFIIRTGSNNVLFATSGSQVIQSLDGNTTLTGKANACILKKCLNNNYYLIGGLS